MDRKDAERIAFNYYQTAIALAQLQEDKEKVEDMVYGYLFDALADDNVNPRDFIILAVKALL